MTRIDFYQITDSRYSADELIFKLCHKAYDNEQPVLVHTNSQQQTDHLDRLLWVRDDQSFLPHDQLETEGFLSPILINHQANPMGERELLINLNDQIPLFFAQFKRVFELVTEQNKGIAREHYSYYKDRGYELNHHQL